MKRGTEVFAVVLLLAGSAVAHPGTPPIERNDVPLAGGGRQTHDVVLRSGDALRGTVEQRGIDVVVKVRRPDGGVALDVDSPNGTDGPEPVALVASSAGTYVVEVSALDAQAPAGRYHLRLEAPRAATRADRDAAEALALHIRAFTARNEALAFMGQAKYQPSAARYAEAERWARRALELRERTQGAQHYDVAMTLQVLGLIADEVGDYEEGERYFARAVRIMEALLGPESPDAVGTRIDHAYLRLAAGDYAGAEALFTRGIARREELYGAQSERVLAGMGGLTEALLKQGQLERAETTARRVLAIREAVKQPSPGSLTSLGLIALARGRTGEAEDACQQARTAAEARGESGRTQVATAQLCLGRARQAAGDAAGAKTLMAEGVRIREAAYGPDHPSLAEALAQQGQVIAAQGDAKQGRDRLQRALAIQQRRLGSSHPAIRETAEALRALDK